MEAQITSGRLDAAGIKNQVQGSRAYTSVVMGGTDGRWQIFVNEEDFEKAQNLIQQPVLSTAEEEATPDPRLALKKAVMFAFFSILILPIVFHYYSIQQALIYWKLEPRLQTKLPWIIFISLLYILSLAGMWIIFKTGIRS